jgi:hypothetical protein
LHLGRDFAHLLLQEIAPVVAVAELFFLLGVQLFQVESDRLLVQLEVLECFYLLLLAGRFDLVKVNFELLIIGKQQIAELLQIEIAVSGGC